jgi:hypothetical protein
VDHGLQKPFLQDPFSMITEARCGRRVEATGSMSTRSLLENQMNTLGPFPLSSTSITKWDDFDGPTLNTMLESVIEPIDHSDPILDSSRNNRKRRRPMKPGLSLISWNLGERQELSNNPFLEEQIMPKRGWQTELGNTDFNSNGSSLARSSDGLSTLRRLSLLGDRKIHPAPDGGQQCWQTMSYHLEAAANLSAQHLMNLPSLGGSQPLQAESNPFSTNNLCHSGASDQCLVSPITPQCAWDLEPTPISAPEQKIDNHA